MIRRNPLATALAVAFVIAFLDIALLVSGYRILVHEVRGYETIVEGNPMLGIEGSGYSTLECSYFTGRSVQVSRGDQLDECPTIFKPYPGAGL